ncbi:hypothetical protein KKC94_02235 [Patescibacteria group bacterium]|nr:hypothetical protein [Patescibacteria group bacterium]
MELSPQKSPEEIHFEAKEAIFLEHYQNAAVHIVHLANPRDAQKLWDEENNYRLYLRKEAIQAITAGEDLMLILLKLAHVDYSIGELRHIYTKINDRIHTMQKILQALSDPEVLASYSHQPGFDQIYPPEEYSAKSPCESVQSVLNSTASVLRQSLGRRD